MEGLELQIEIRAYIYTYMYINLFILVIVVYWLFSNTRVLSSTLRFFSPMWCCVIFEVGGHFMILSIPIYLSFALFYSREKSAFSFVHSDGDGESLHP